MAAAALSMVTVAAVTHEGRVRQENEDCIVVGDWLQNEPMRSVRVSRQPLEAPLVCMVLDGMGGHAHGEVASQLAARHLLAGLPGLDSDRAVRDCVRAAHDMLFDHTVKNPHCRGMGTTLAGIRISTAGMLVFNVGDSRVYSHRDGVLTLLSIDDVYLPPGWQGRSGLITQSLGGSLEPSDVDPHILEQPPAPQATYLLCSDGLYDQVAPESLQRVIDADCGASAARLLRLALDAGARDNVSIVLVKIEPAQAAVSK